MLVGADPPLCWHTRVLQAQQTIYGCEKGKLCTDLEESTSSTPDYQPVYRLDALIYLP